MAQYEADPNWISKILTPTFFMAFAFTFAGNFVLSSLFFKYCLSDIVKEKIGNKKSHFLTLLGSTVHAVTASLFSCYFLIAGELRTNTSLSTSPLGYTAYQVSLGYAIADLTICCLDPHLRKDSSNLLHHLAIISGLVLSTYHGGLFMYFIVYRPISEFSTPLVNLRWILYRVGNKTGHYYAFTSLGMTMSFFLCRIIVIPWHSYMLCSALFGTDSHLVPIHLRVIMLVNFTAFDVLNVFWFIKIAQGAYKFYATPRKVAQA